MLPPLQVNGLTVSSSAIREALRDGDVEQARAFLGRPYSLTGDRAARRRPRPDARVSHRQPQAGPPAAPGRRGSTRPTRAGTAVEAEAVVNIGYRPTFEESQYWVEAYLFDFAGDLYDRTLTLDFLSASGPR